VILAPWIERTATRGTFAVTLHILIHSQDMLARATKHRFFASLATRPGNGFVGFAFIVAANARVEFAAAIVLDGNDVER
jgi:hypothetical protein